MTEHTSETTADYRFGTNPIADVERAGYAAKFDAQASTSTPPKMFSGGTADVPAFTVSGIDPNELLRLPYGVRHAAASEPDRAVVHAMFEQYGHQPDAEIEHEGLTEARARMQHWTKTTHDPRSSEQQAADDHAEYLKMCEAFGWDHRSQAERRADEVERGRQRKDLQAQLRRL